MGWLSVCWLQEQMQNVSLRLIKTSLCLPFRVLLGSLEGKLPFQQEDVLTRCLFPSMR